MIHWEVTKQDMELMESAEEYAKYVTIDEHNCARWQHSEQLIEDYVLDELYRNGYISANVRSSTLTQIMRESQSHHG